MFTLHNDLIPMRETNFAAKRNRIESNLSESRSILLERLDMEREEKSALEDFEKSRMAESFGIPAKKREARKALQEQLESNYKTMVNLLIESMNELFYDAIILDESFKEKFRPAIYDISNRFFNESFEAGVITLQSFEESGSSTVREIFEVCAEYTEKIAESASADILGLLETAKEERKNANDRISSTVKDKVAKTVKTEKEISEKNKQQIEDAKAQEHVVMKQADPSLFRSIIINNSRSPINENGDTTDRLDMDMIFSESVIQYTLLEMLHTTRLVKFTPQKAQEIAFNFRYKA